MAICRMSVTSLVEPQFVSYCLWLQKVSGKRLRDTDSVKLHKWKWVRVNRTLRTSDSCTVGVGTELITSSDILHRSCVTLHTQLHSWNTCRDSWKYVNCSEFLSSHLVAPGCRAVPIDHASDKNISITQCPQHIVYFKFFYTRSQNCEKHLLSSSYLYVCVSVRLDKLGCHWTDVNENSNLNIFRKSVENILVSLKSMKYNG